MLSKKLVFDSNGDIFDITGVKIESGLAILCICSKQNQCSCPGCGMKSKKLHSYYFRSIKDLPIFENSVRIRLRSRKFYCNNNTCKKKVFTEQFDHYFTRYKRMSGRLHQKLLKIALLTGGNAGARLCRTLNIPVSSSSLIRLIHHQKLVEPNISHALGIDDWAYKKGHNYGTAIIDLEQHRIVDLLPDREASTVEKWLRERTEVKIITRDRFSRYAKGVTNGLPNVTQVADRWHLLKNMGDAIKKMLERKCQELKSIRKLNEQTGGTMQRNKKLPGKKLGEMPLTKRHKQLEDVKKLYNEGIAIRAIARVLKMSKNTVRKYIQLHEPPRKNGLRKNILKFNAYFQSRLEEEPNVKVIQLWKEIKAKGYNGGRSAVYEYLKGYCKGRTDIGLPQIPSWIPSDVSLLLYRKEELLSNEEKKLINDLKRQSQDIEVVSILAHKFRRMMEDKQGYLLKGWIDDVLQSPLKELKGFARGLLSDFQAVENALTLPWSNGQVEGQINKLKTIKRQMYGRASFELLRRRMILGHG